ncbi:type II toxin-antitoxin system RelB/DinJ family antitoxin [Bifidobacterium sp. ESL0790]|uniref:type II toxin-antitoxin system RelB/DinJ family antitoxin n=1 Tax=Bifidobacterium sp. ESL0790 TaxID=2983233 RepID=UPI0023F6AD2F|nr:type II toxin-antitoxin system RelB/DinJ family antitoxin [Bifidobacterium sp. ESL0790]WEV71941.1 type II toxin-antitoxin system RelB/DinJ family antitoxin [Bifidobacterium sp. ESL0790]
MTMVQMNVRVDAEVKADVDKILERLGKTPSSVVRDLWDFIKDHGETPDLNTALQNEDLELQKQQELGRIHSMSGIVPKMLENAGLIGRGDDPFAGKSAEELHDYADEQRYLEYLGESEPRW